MHKKTLAVLLVVFMLAMGGVKIYAKSCEVISSWTESTCEGDNCYKNGATGPHYIYRIIKEMRCWDNDGSEFITQKRGERQRSGCC